MSKTRNHEKVISLSAIATALAALFVAVWQGIETRNHNRMSVIPKLSINRKSYTDVSSVTKGAEPGFSVVNNGTGPAIIKEVRIFITDSLGKEKMYNDWSNAFSKDNLNMSADMVRCYNFHSGEALREGHSERLLFMVPGDQDRLDKFNNEFLKIRRIEIDYESIYKEKFTRVYPLKR